VSQQKRAAVTAGEQSSFGLLYFLDQDGAQFSQIQARELFTCPKGLLSLEVAAMYRLLGGLAVEISSQPNFKNRLEGTHCCDFNKSYIIRASTKLRARIFKHEKLSFQVCV
jgi:hypothetical protein